MSINCRVSFKNNALKVVDKNGQPSKLYYDALELTGNEDKAFDLWYKAFSQEFTEQVKANNDDVTLDEVLKFVSANSSFRKSLDLSEVREIKDIMDKNSFSTLSSFSKTLNGIFRPDGITELNTRKAYESGLYDLEGLSEVNLDEIDDLLDKIDGTLSRADIYVTPSSDTSANFIDTSKRTILGTPEFISQEEIEEEIISKVESTRDVSEITSLINNLPYSSFAEKFNSNESFKEQILKNIGAYTKVDTLFIEDDIATKKNLTYYNNLRRSVKRDNDVKSLLADVEYLEGIDDNVWAENQEEVKEVLKEIEERQFDENGIDVFGLSKFSSNKKLVLDTLDSLGLMIEKPTNENIFAFSEKFVELVPQPSSTVSEIIPESLEPFSNNVFKVHSTLSETELFRDHGLVKVGENLYHKVDLGKRSDLYEQLYQKAKEEGSPIYLKSEDKREGLRELEQYVMLQDSPLEKDVKEEHILNKLIFNHPKTQDTNDYSQLSDITTDPEYLVGGFPTDFSDYIVTEKQKDSQLYRSTLSKFRVGQAGIYLTSPVSSIEGIDFQKELEDYIRLSKDQSMKYLLPARPTNLKQDAELKAINDPLSVPVYSRQYSVDNGLLVTESTPNNNIRFYGKTYSKVAEDTKNSIFKQVPASPNNNFYSVNKDFITEEDRKVAAQVLNDAKFSFVDSVTTEEDFDNSLDKAGIKNEVKFSIFGPKGAARLDAKEESTRRIDNLKTAIEMLGGKTFDQLYPKQKKAIKLATEWELGVDNKWKYDSITDSNATLNLGINSIEDLDKKKKLSEVLDYPELFDAYPQIKNLKISVSEKGGSTGEASFSPSKNEIIIGIKKYKLEEHFKEKEKLDEISYLREEVFEALKFMAEKALRIEMLEKGGMSFIDALDKVSIQFTYQEEDKHSEILDKAGLLAGDKYFSLLTTLMKGLSGEIQESDFYDFDAKTLTSVLHEIQHWIQQKEGFARGGNAYIALRLATPAQKEELDLALEEVRKLQSRGIDFSNASSQEMEILLKPFDLEDTLYRSVAGEVEARNVEERLGLSDEARKGLLLEDTADMFPFRQKVYYSSLDLINKKSGAPVVEAAIEQLKQTGLANRVNLMTSEEISKQLEDIGIDPSIKKQLDNISESNKEELAQDYFVREADRLPLTLSVFNRPEFVKMQGKVVNKISILNSLNQSGIKQIEKDLIKNVIEDYYKDQTKVSYDEVEATVRANIMPLEVLNTDSYSNYGMDNLSNGDYGDANTIIFNSPIEHGVVGHFKSSFISENREDLKYVPKQLNNNTWVAVQEGYEDQANGNNIYQFVGTAGTKEDVDTWISAYNNPNNFIDLNDKSLKLEISEVSPSTKSSYPDSDIVDIQLFKNGEVLMTMRAVPRASELELKEQIVNSYNQYQTSVTPAINKGMFGHIRVWTDGDIYNVAELQSDYFQNNNARKKALDRNTEYATAFADKSDKLKTLREKRDSSIDSLKDSGYINVYDREGAKSKSEVFRPINSFGQEVGKRDGIEAVKFGLYYALSIDGELKTGSVYRTEELAENQIKTDSEKADNYKTIDETQPLTENEMPDELKDAFNFVTKDFYTEEKNIEKDFSNTTESIIANLPLVEKQFIASQKEWEKRMVREALRLASSSGASKLRLPTPHTLSVIEGYISGNGAPYEILSADNHDRLSPGDRIDYLDADSTVISSNRDEIEIVLSEDVIKYNIEDYINDELDYFTNEVLNYESGLDFENKYTEEEFNDADKHSSLDGVDLDEIAEKVEDDLYEISRDKVEQTIKDYFSIFYNEDNIESVLSDQGYENINVDGKFVYFTMRGVETESLSQPDEYSDADKDTFSISDLTDTQQTVANKYVELAEILRKEVGEDNVETVTDDQGFDWYETDVEDKYSNKAVVAFKKGLSEKGVKPIVNGFVHNNDVYLNRDTITSETPIHEFNHLFTKWMKSNRPSLYNKGIALVKEELTKEDSDIASVIDYVQQTQPDLQGEKFFEEILTELTGREGASLLESGRKSGIIEWIRSFFKEIGNMLGILDATPEQVAKMTTREFAKSSAVQLLKGEDILSKMNILKDSVANSISFPYEYTPVNDTVESVAEELRACN